MSTTRSNLDLFVRNISISPSARDKKIAREAEAKRLFNDFALDDDDFVRTLPSEEALRTSRRKSSRGAYRSGKERLQKTPRPLSSTGRSAWESRLREIDLARATTRPGITDDPETFDRRAFDDLWGRRDTAMRLTGIPQPIGDASARHSTRMSTIMLPDRDGNPVEVWDTFGAKTGEEADGYSDTAENFDPMLYNLLARWEKQCERTFGVQREVDITLVKVQLLAQLLLGSKGASQRNIELARQYLPTMTDETLSYYAAIRLTQDQRQQGWDQVRETWKQLKEVEFPKRREVWAEWVRGRDVLRRIRTSIQQRPHIPRVVTIICEQEFIGDSNYLQPDGVELSLLRDYSMGRNKMYRQPPSVSNEEWAAFIQKIDALADIVADSTPQEQEAPAEAPNFSETTVSYFRGYIELTEVQAPSAPAPLDLYGLLINEALHNEPHLITNYAA